MNWEKCPDLDWAVASGSHIRQILETTYWENHGYWRYLNELVAFLRSKDVSQIQQKLRDANDLLKFHSIVSELDFARVFAERGKAVTLLPDSFFGKAPSPDMLVKDEKREAFVEVKRLTEDDSELLIVDFLRDFLNDPNKKYRVDTTLSRELSVPLTSGKERRRKESIVHKIVTEFPTIFESTRRSTLSILFEIEGVEFELHPSNLDKGYPGFIHTDAFVFPSELWAQKLAERMRKGEKARQVDRSSAQEILLRSIRLQRGVFGGR